MNIWSVFVQFLRLGCICFGGPTAHIGVFRSHFVDRLGWVTVDAFAHDLTLCQLVPGPASSQLGMLIGARRAGIAGSVAAWLGFTVPSALLLTAAAVGNQWLLQVPGLTAGLLFGAAVTVTWAVGLMLVPLRANRHAIGLALVSTVLLLVAPNPQTQIVVLLASGLYGALVPAFASDVPQAATLRVDRRIAGGLLLLFVGLLGWSWLAPSLEGMLFQTGALVFGGGHVVLPMLLERIPVLAPAAGSTIAQGYALAQLVPGPLFTLATYLGAVLHPQPFLGAATATVAMFLPGWLLILGIQPWWAEIAAHPRVGMALKGTHAAVIGLLCASGVRLVQLHVAADLRTLVGACILLGCLWRFRLPPWTVAIIGALFGVCVLG